MRGAMLVTGSWAAPTSARGFGVLVHGGAGDVPADRVASHRAGCGAAARAAAEILARGGSALDAVQRAVEVLEDDPQFNAGTGACLDESGEVALDASIMEGAGARAGGVTILPPFQHPIAIARAVLEDGQHVLYASEGATEFARRAGFAPSTQAAMTTPAARERWEMVRRGDPEVGWAGGTVGAVACDARGSVAAATSTGGTTNKRRGRVGDTPIIGAGTFADDGAGAASNTGHGEGVMRTCLGYWAVEAMRAGAAPDEAARRAIEHLGARVGSRGGIILVDPRGRIGLARSTATMSWGAAWAGCPDVVTGI